MILWRISKYLDLTGNGGLISSGRWHTKPKCLVYCSEEAETAYAEVIYHLTSPLLLPKNHKLIKIDCPDSLPIEHVEIEGLATGWNSDAAGPRICRPHGDHWFRNGRSPLLRVPSAARSGHFNLILNPAVREADFAQIVEIIDQPFSGVPDFF
jgi:RES domain-containing protein